jgi:hypothetical protein
MPEYITKETPKFSFVCVRSCWETTAKEHKEFNLSLQRRKHAHRKMAHNLRFGSTVFWNIYFNMSTKNSLGLKMEVVWSSETFELY